MQLTSLKLLFVFLLAFAGTCANSLAQSIYYPSWYGSNKVPSFTMYTNTGAPDYDFTYENDSPALASSQNGTLWTAYRQQGGDYLSIGYSSDAVNFTTNYTGVYMCSAPAMVLYNGLLYIAFWSDSNTISIYRINEGSSTVTPTELPARRRQHHSS